MFVVRGSHCRHASDIPGSGRRYRRPSAAARRRQCRSRDAARSRRAGGEGRGVRAKLRAVKILDTPRTIHRDPARLTCFRCPKTRQSPPSGHEMSQRIECPHGREEQTRTPISTGFHYHALESPPTSHSHLCRQPLRMDRTRARAAREQSADPSAADYVGPDYPRARPREADKKCQILLQPDTPSLPGGYGSRKEDPMMDEGSR